MSLFLDNDALSKLASWDLLEDGIIACGFEPADVRYLPTARFWLGLAGKKKCKHSPEAQDRLKSLLAAGQECADDPSDKDGQLPQVDGIDPGEAILLTQAARSTGSFLTTGDKTCIKAMVEAPAYTDIAASLAGRVLCLEQVLLRVIEHLGFDEVKRRIVTSNQLDLDTAVRAAFGSGMQADDLNARWSLEQRVRILGTSAAGMLAPQTYRYSSDGEQLDQ